MVVRERRFDRDVETVGADRRRMDDMIGRYSAAEPSPIRTDWPTAGKPPPTAISACVSPAAARVISASPLAAPSGSRANSVMPARTAPGGITRRA